MSFVMLTSRMRTYLARIPDYEWEVGSSDGVAVAKVGSRTVVGVPNSISGNLYLKGVITHQIDFSNLSFTFAPTVYQLATRLDSTSSSSTGGSKTATFTSGYAEPIATSVAWTGVPRAVQSSLQPDPVVALASMPPKDVMVNLDVDVHGLLLALLERGYDPATSWENAISCAIQSSYPVRVSAAVWAITDSRYVLAQSPKKFATPLGQYAQFYGGNGENAPSVKIENTWELQIVSRVTCYSSRWVPWRGTGSSMNIPVPVAGLTPGAQFVVTTPDFDAHSWAGLYVRQTSYTNKTFNMRYFVVDNFGGYIIT